MHKLAKQLQQAHQFAPYKHKQQEIKNWRKSWLHQKYVNTAKPDVLAIAHATMLDVALAQKETFQKKAEAIRLEFFELWQDMDYTQRNAFLLRYLASTYHDFIAFESHGEHIVVPFLNPLLNALIVKRPAVFDLAQYFKLYKDFKEQCVDPVKVYGNDLLTSKFYPFTFVLSQANRSVMWDAQTHALIVCDNYQYVEAYPLYAKHMDETVVTTLAHYILHEDWHNFVAYGCEHALFHPKLHHKWVKMMASTRRSKL